MPLHVLDDVLIAVIYFTSEATRYRGNLYSGWRRELRARARRDRKRDIDERKKEREKEREAREREWNDGYTITRVSATRSDNRRLKRSRSGNETSSPRKGATRNAARTSPCRTPSRVQWQNYASTLKTRFVTKVPQTPVFPCRWPYG